MRIAIVGTELCAVDDRGGGLERVLLRWAEHLAASHTVVVVSHGSPQPVAGVDTIAVEDTGELTRALRRVAPDVVSLHNRPQWSELVTGPARIAVTFHNYPQAWNVPDSAVATLGPHRYSAVSVALARQSASHLGHPVAVTPPSIDPAFVTPPPWRPRREVLSPNRLLRKKGVDNLLAIARRPSFSSVSFAFADLISPWDHATAEHLELRRAIDRVENAFLFPPARSAGELAERYARSAVVACAVTESEGLGLVALEAQACGVPLVTVDLGGLREATFAPNRCVPAGDLEALAQAIEQGLDRPLASGGGPRREVVGRYAPQASGEVFSAWLEVG